MFKKRISFIILMMCMMISSMYAKEIKRIVSLSPSGTEIIFALEKGDLLKARTQFCNYPEEAKKLPVAGGFDGKTISIETILSYNPDFVYLSDGMHNHLIPLLESFGIKYYVSNVDSLNSLYDEIKNVAKILQCEEKGTELVYSIQTEIESVLKKYKTVSKKNDEKVFVELCSSPYITCGKNSYLNEILELAGFENIFSDIKSGYPSVSEEEIVFRNPDVIIAPDYSESQISSVYRRSTWKKTSAVQKKRVYSVNGDLFSRPSPRVAQAVKILLLLGDDEDE